MAVKQGYNLTEVGIIPNDWKVVNLNSVCNMKSGEGITSSDIDDFSEAVIICHVIVIFSPE